jgi:uncharacterized protein YqfB (UPF0267 family)
LLDGVWKRDLSSSSVVGKNLLKIDRRLSNMEHGHIDILGDIFTLTIINNRHASVERLTLFPDRLSLVDERFLNT